MVFAKKTRIVSVVEVVEIVSDIAPVPVPDWIQAPFASLVGALPMAMLFCTVSVSVEPEAVARFLHRVAHEPMVVFSR